MQANELRIGNLVIKSLKSGNGRKIEAEIGHADIARIFEKTGSFNYEPIPLTEEWLVRFGFIYDPTIAKQNQSYWDKYGNQRIFSLAKYEEGLFFEDIVIGGDIYKTEIKHVHQLQNLYFALTGTELTLKP
jgi:hypothetical protein